MKKYSTVSMINELPELDQIDNEMERKIPSVIRNKMILHEDSGMADALFSEPPPEPKLPPPQNFENIHYQNPGPFYHNQPQNVIPIKPNPQEYGNEVIENFKGSYDCRSIFDHIESCPICKRFYKQDNTILLIIIAFLVVVCAILLKKLLRV